MRARVLIERIQELIDNSGNPEIQIMMEVVYPYEVYEPVGRVLITPTLHKEEWEDKFCIVIESAFSEEER